MTSTDSPGADVTREASRTWLLGVGLAGLYLAQGLVHGAQGSLVRIAAAEGRSLEHQAGLLAWGALPWVLKFAWGVLEDRLLPRDAPRHARVLLALQLGVAAATLPLAARFDAASAPYLLFCLNLILSWQDVATDAFAIDHIPADLRGRINGAMGGARLVGATLLGAVAFVAALPRFGVRGCVIATAFVLALLGLAPVLLARASAPTRGEARVPTRAPREPFEWLIGLRPGLALICALTLLGDGLVSAIGAEFLFNTAGWTLEQATNVLSPVNLVTELAGFALAAAFVDRLEPRRAIAIGATSLALVWTFLALAPGLWTHHGVVLGVATIEGLARACLLVGVYAACMAGVDARIRATHFLIYMALINLGPVLGAWAAPQLFSAWSFPGVWSCAAALQLGLAGLALGSLVPALDAEG